MELRENVRVPSRTRDSPGQTKPHLAGLVSLQPASALLLLLPHPPLPELSGLCIFEVCRQVRIPTSHLFSHLVTKLGQPIGENAFPLEKYLRK